MSALKALAARLLPTTPIAERTPAGLVIHEDDPFLALLAVESHDDIMEAAEVALSVNGRVYFLDEVAA